MLSNATVPAMLAAPWVHIIRKEQHVVIGRAHFRRNWAQAASNFSRQIRLRGLQTVAIGAAYGLWLYSQHLLESKRPVVHGLRDHAHEVLSAINTFLNAHPHVANVVLATSSFEVDVAAVSMVIYFFARRESRPLLALWFTLIMRQLCQASVSIPAPEGMIWHYPGFPSIMVTYSTSTDFFFSGHMALATLLAMELTVQRAPRWSNRLRGWFSAFRRSSSCPCGFTMLPTWWQASSPQLSRRRWRKRWGAFSMNASLCGHCRRRRGQEAPRRVYRRWPVRRRGTPPGKRRGSASAARPRESWADVATSTGYPCARTTFLSTALSSTASPRSSGRKSRCL